MTSYAVCVSHLLPWTITTGTVIPKEVAAAAAPAVAGFLQVALGLAGACRNVIGVLSIALLAIVCLTTALWAAGCRRISADERLSSLLIREGC